MCTFKVSDFNDLGMDNKCYLVSDQWMYWGDAGTHNIERARLDGSERKVIFYNANSHYFSMLLYSNNLFYTDWQHR
jgi:hypothetical protein